MRLIVFYGLAALTVGGLACRKPVVAPAPTPVIVNVPGVQAPKPAPEEPDTPAAPPVARKRVLDVPVWTQTIAVLDPKVTATTPKEFTEDVAQPVTEQVESAFLGTGRFDLVERARLESVKKELTSTSDSLWFDQTSVAKMGKFLGARYIILPSARLEIGVASTRIDLLVKVLDTETASIVQTFSVRTSSSSLSTNASVTAALDRIRLELAEAIAPVYPAQGVIVHSPRPGVFWVEAKQTRAFRAGQKVRILQTSEVFNPIKSTTGTFSVEAGRGRVQSVESQGIVIKATGVKAEEGWLIELLP